MKRTVEKERKTEDRLFASSIFSYFIRSLNARIESRENWTPAQNGILDWVRSKDAVFLLRA